MNKILEVTNLHKTFTEGKITTPVLQGINFEAHESECIAILGSSGSGKTTFLQIIGGLQGFESGEIIFQNQSYTNLTDEAMTRVREQHFGFVYQFHHLLPELTALENVMMPLMIRKCNKQDAKAAAMNILEQVGLSHRLQHKPGELSGGERQRVALARAMVKKPHLLLADEPTGNLDRHASQNVIDLIFNLSRELKTTVIFITHDEALAQKASRIVRMQDGFLSGH